MHTPQNTKELSQKLEEFGTLIVSAQKLLNDARELVLNNGIASKRLSNQVARAACVHGMDHIAAGTMAEDLRGTMRLIMQAVEEVKESLGGVQNRLGSAEHIVHAIVHRAPRRPADGVMSLEDYTPVL